jgi:hypothetical protein
VVEPTWPGFGRLLVTGYRCWVPKRRPFRQERPWHTFRSDQAGTLQRQRGGHRPKRERRRELRKRRCAFCGGFRSALVGFVAASWLLADDWPLWQVLTLAMILVAPFAVGTYQGLRAIRFGDRRGWIGAVVHITFLVVALPLPITESLTGLRRSPIRSVPGCRLGRRQRRSGGPGRRRDHRLGLAASVDGNERERSPPVTATAPCQPPHPRRARGVAGRGLGPGPAGFGGRFALREGDGP